MTVLSHLVSLLVYFVKQLHSCYENSAAAPLNATH